MRIEVRVKPIGTDTCGPTGGDPPPKLPVGRYQYDRCGRSGDSQLDEEVVAATGSMEHADAVSEAFRHTGSCGTLDDDDQWRIEPPADGVGAELLNQAPGRSRPVPPPPVGPAPDHVRGVDEQHRERGQRDLWSTVLTNA